MKRDTFRHGFPESDWQAAKEEARAAMIKRARTRRTIAYSDLVAEIQSVKLDPHSAHLSHLLGLIAEEESENGRGMLTVVVVHKSGDQKPGPGFFEMARKLGRTVLDPDEFWINELKRVHEVWAAGKP
jgi:hypothetical protein